MCLGNGALRGGIWDLHALCWLLEWFVRECMVSVENDV
ncbi:hypothetical protein BSCA_1540 [Bifidobacterium scardovii]|uniref:Uncharacterized protein n=1 Tax=Bifidobacterium scardovii TaxID=158787 RepID=A0A087D587_9BIFI|nr:hypothetical protein BSCA_1540 [Bifidobacterium scardovii]